MKIEMIWKGDATLIVQRIEGQRPRFWNRSAGAFLESAYQATHYRSRRLAETVWHKIIVNMEGAL